MRYSIELYFDSATESRLLSLWETLLQAQLEPPNRDRPGATPHVSIAVFEAPELPAEISSIVDETACSSRPVSTRLSAVGSFPTAQGVVYVAPVVTEQLLALHKALHLRLASLAIDLVSLYTPGQWIPHCTIAIELPPEKVPIAVEVARGADVFGPASFTEIGLLQVRPIRMLHRRKFQAEAG